MSQYEAPQISSRQTLTGSLDPLKSVQKGFSDAHVKHGVTPLETVAYQAPRIVGKRELDAKLIPISQVIDS